MGRTTCCRNRSANSSVKKLVANQHKVFALNIIEIVDFLFLKHIINVKNEDTVASGH